VLVELGQIMDLILELMEATAFYLELELQHLLPMEEVVDQDMVVILETVISAHLLTLDKMVDPEAEAVVQLTEIPVLELQQAEVLEMLVVSTIILLEMEEFMELVAEEVLVLLVKQVQTQEVEMAELVLQMIL
jgi:hypothetical protein